VELVYGLFPYVGLLLIFTLSTLSSYLSKTKIFFYFSVLMVLFFVGFKDILSPDFERYALTYDNIENFRLGAFEPLFIVLSKILKNLGLSYYSLFFIYSFLTIFFILAGIKNLTKHQYFAFLLFLLVPGFFLNMFVEMRQILAVAIVFYSIELFLSKKKSFLLFAILSIITHYSAIFFWVIFVFIYRSLKKMYSFKTYTILLVLSFILVAIFRADLYVFNIVFKLPLPFFKKYVPYLEYVLNLGIDQVQLQFFKNTFYIMNVLFLLFIFRKFCSNKQQAEIVMLNLIFIGVLILNIAYYIGPISRLAYYFLIFQIVVIPNIVFSLKWKELKILILYIYTVLFCIMFIKGLFYYSQEAQTYIFLNYKNILLEGLLK